MKKIIRALLILLSVSFLVLGSSVVILGIYVQKNYELHLPNDFFESVAPSSSPRFFIYDFTDRSLRQGEVREVTEAVFAQKKSEYVPLSKTPSYLQDAFIAVEDKHFFEHHGVDWRRTALACIRYMFGDKDTFGASTITQQLVKNVTGNDEVSIQRKLQEILFALDLERTLDKHQILELYMNVIGFSDQCVGIFEAAQHYYSKEPCELTLDEAATIAAITNSPLYYNPIRNPQNNKQRRDLILSLMHEQGVIDQETYTEAIGMPIETNVQVLPQKSHSWFLETVADDVISDLMNKEGISRSAATRRFYHGGLSVYMTMDESIQEQVQEYYQKKISTPVDENGNRAQSAVVIIDAQTGDLLALVGAIGEKNANLIQNFATHTLRPPGSTIKPLTVFAPAIERGLINWASVYDDIPVRYNGKALSPWPKNANGVYRGLTTVSYAVAHSTNTVAVRILENLTCEYSFFFAKERFGLQSLRRDGQANDCDFAALALGQMNYGVTLRELTSAYTAFADGGVLHPSRSYFRVLDREGRILLSNANEGKRALSEASAALMTKLLEGVISEGTSSTVTLDRIVECAGKTGTSNHDYDRWFIGYTPEVVCGVWCGFEYPKPIVQRNVCTQIWDDIMHAVVNETGNKHSFDKSPDLIRVSYCQDSGLLATKACECDPRGSRIKTGWFIKGSEPTTFCTTHVLCTYDVENGGISHGTCPEGCTKEIGMLRYERHLPRALQILDAQYLLPTDPLVLSPNPDPTLPYYAIEKGFWGIADGLHPYNRSCTVHGGDENEDKTENVDGE